MRAHELQRSVGGSDDEYEEDYEDQEAEYEEDDQGQDDPQPTKEELEILKLREKFKERERQRLRKENGAALGVSQEKKRTTLPHDKFGSFFGPSQTVIARRVIDEATAAQQIVAKVSNPTSGNAKSHTSRTTETKTIKALQLPKKVNEGKLKAEKLKQNRDYSFILSEDAELPAPSKEPAPRNISVPNCVISQRRLIQVSAHVEDARSIQVPSNNKPSTSKPSRLVSGVHKGGNSVPSNRQLQRKVEVPKTAPASKLNSFSGDRRKSLNISGGSGPGRPKPSLSKAPVLVTDKKAPIKGLSNSGPSLQKAPILKPQSSVQRQSAEQRRQPHGLEKPAAKFLSKQPVSSQKSQSKPLKPSLPRSMHEERPKKRPINKHLDEDEDDDEDEDAAALNMIRKITGYNPNRFRHVDDDDSDMEVGFSQIQDEERRSAKIAREEDERELALIEEEERRERERKRRKLKLKQR